MTRELSLPLLYGKEIYVGTLDIIYDKTQNILNMELKNLKPLSTGFKTITSVSGIFIDKNIWTPSINVNSTKNFIIFSIQGVLTANCCIDRRKGYLIIFIPGDNHIFLAYRHAWLFWIYLIIPKNMYEQIRGILKQHNKTKAFYKIKIIMPFMKARTNKQLLSCSLECESEFRFLKVYPCYLVNSSILNSYYRIGRIINIKNLTFFYGLGDFSETIIGSQIYIPPAHNRRRNLPFQPPLVIPTLGAFPGMESLIFGRKRNPIYLEEFPTIVYLDTLFVAVAIKDPLMIDLKTLDSKALIKAIVHEYVRRALINIYSISKFDLNKLLSECKRKVCKRQNCPLVQYIKREGIKVLNLGRLTYEHEFTINNLTNNIQTINVKYVTVKYLAIERLYKVASGLITKNPKDRGKLHIIGSSIADAIFASILYRILREEGINAKFDEVYNICLNALKAAGLSYSWSSNYLWEALKIAASELGIHALLHMIIKYLAMKYGIRERDFGELIIINSSKVGKFRTFRGIYEGFIYRLSDQDMPDDMKLFTAIGVVYIRKSSGGKEILEDINKGPKAFFEELFSNINSRIFERNVDRCYWEWHSILRRARENALKTIKLSTRNIPLMSIRPTLSVSDAIETLENKLLIPYLGVKDNIEAERKFYFSYTELRRLIYDEGLNCIIENYKLPKTIDIRKEIRKNILKPYAVLLYEAHVPPCFDGCHNCVLLESCQVPGPFKKPYYVSKYFLKSFLQ